LRQLFLYIFILYGTNLLSKSLIEGTYYPYESGYFLGRGHTGIALPEPNEEPIFYNPAGLAPGKGFYRKTIFLSPQLVFSQDSKSIMEELALKNADITKTLRAHEGIPQNLGISTFSGVLFRKAAIGFYGHSSSHLILFKDPNFGALETLSLQSRTDLGLTLTLASPLWESGFFVGTTFKYIKRAAVDFEANITQADDIENLIGDGKVAMIGTGTGVDLGLLYRIEKGRQAWSLGATIQDVGDTRFTPQKQTAIPRKDRPLKDNLQALHLGVAWVTKTQASELRLLGDLRDITESYGGGYFKRVHIGGEINILNIVGVTGGLSQGYPTVGCYLDTRILRIDLGMYTEELGIHPGSRPDPRIFLKITGGI
jgi:hypothetical protein